MENLSEYNEQQENNLQVDAVAQATMLEMGRWTKFLGIMGYIFTGFLVLGGIAVSLSFALNNVTSPLLNSLGTVGALLLYILLAILYFYPSYRMHRYAANIKKAIRNNDQILFYKSLNHLKGVFVYAGILTIIIIIIYGILIMSVGIGAAIGAHHAQ